MSLVQSLKDSVLRGVERLGYRVIKEGHTSDLPAREPYGMVVLDEMYAPWLTDRRFLEVYETIRSHTLVDIYRCYELWMLVDQCAKLDGAIIEVGVWRGGTGALIAKRAKLSGIHDPVYLCDTFTGVVKASDSDSHYQGGEHADTSRAQVEALIRKTLDLDNVVILEGVFPEATSAKIANQRLRFCHVDVDVYQSAQDILEWVWGRLVVGGMIVYDDYGFRSCDGITKHVEEQRGLSDRLVVHNLNKHAIVIKIR
jgi:O-methyltransferase